MPANPQHVSTIQLGATMTAMTEVCGLSQPADADKGLQSMKQETAKSGVSDAQTERVFREADMAASRTPFTLNDARAWPQASTSMEIP